MRVLKFGGSSVADADRIRRVGAIIQQARRRGPVVVVVSALGGVTDELARMADLAAPSPGDTLEILERIRARHLHAVDELAPADDEARGVVSTALDGLDRLVTGVGYIGDCPPAVRDRILATGERLSAPIVAAALRASGCPAEAVDGGDVIRTDSSFGGASIDLDVTTELAARRLSRTTAAPVPVITGFVGADRLQRTTTLGRGGSDLTATALGAALGADGVEIWTDVNGIFTAPPRVVAGARPQPRVSYDEAAELARFGAAVLFASTVAPVRERSIPVLVRNTFDPSGPSTLVDAGPEVPLGARALASIEDASVLKVLAGQARTPVADGISEIASRCLLAALAAAGGSWTLAVHESDAASVADRLRSRGLAVDRLDDASLIAVVGSRLLEQPWVAGRALEALGRRSIPLRAMVSPTEHSVCMIVDRSDHTRALEVLHEALMLSHVAGRAADAARREASRGEGGEDAAPQDPSRRDRGHRHRRPTARPSAA